MVYLDSFVVGFRYIKNDGQVRLTLESVCPTPYVYSISSIGVVDCPCPIPKEWDYCLSQLVGQRVTGNSTTLYLGDKPLANRIGYVMIKFLPDWKETVLDHVRA